MNGRAIGAILYRRAAGHPSSVDVVWAAWRPRRLVSGLPASQPGFS